MLYAQRVNLFGMRVVLCSYLRLISCCEIFALESELFKMWLLLLCIFRYLWCVIIVHLCVCYQNCPTLVKWVLKVYTLYSKCIHFKHVHASNPLKQQSKQSIACEYLPYKCFSCLISIKNNQRKREKHLVISYVNKLWSHVSRLTCTCFYKKPRMNVEWTHLWDLGSSISFCLCYKTIHFLGRLKRILV